jgi:hypothetical protein
MPTDINTAEYFSHVTVTNKNGETWSRTYFHDKNGKHLVTFVNGFAFIL